jgi:hypothetical protein
MRRRLNQYGLLLASALLAGMGCDSRGEAEAEVIYISRNLPGSAFTVRLDDGRSARTFRGAEMIQQAEGRQLSTPKIATETSGTLSIEYTLEVSNAIVSQGVVTMALRDDWGWGARIEVDSINPMRSCFGCVASKAFPLAVAYRRVPADSVWVTWGGNYIENPVVY